MKGRPKKDAVPTGHTYAIQATVTLDAAAIHREALRRAAFIVATNVVDLADAAVLATYKRQGSVERGFAFLKDPLFLASSVFLKRPERIMALSVVMVRCLLVYRLAEHRLRTQLAATEQTVPDQLKRPTHRPTMRWIFQCFEGIHLLKLPQAPPLVVGLKDLHARIVTLLGTHVQKFYIPSE
jgi:transposase